MQENQNLLQPDRSDVPTSNLPLAEPVPSPDVHHCNRESANSSRLTRLILVFAILFTVLITPSVVERIQYSITAAQERAKYDVAKEYVNDVTLTHFSNASGLLAHLVGPSVVNIRTNTDMGHDLGQGSGVIVDQDGYIVTNNHVVREVATAEIQLSDGRRGSASVVGRDELLDIAVLKTELEDLKAAEWGDSEQLDVGDLVWAVGSPFGLQKSITFGILSAKERRRVNNDPISRRQRGLSMYQEYLQTDAAVNPGNSGGPLVNSRGQVVGINAAIIGEAYQGISFSIPSSIAKEAYEKLRQDGYIERGWLGVEPTRVSRKISRVLKIEPNQGVLVLGVEQNTPAEDAGLEAGDVILSWNGVSYADPTLLSRAIADTPIGSSVPVVIKRKSGLASPEELELDVVVGARPRPGSF